MGKDFLKIGIFGGTFNPPHLGHLKAMESAITALSLDILYVIPANLPPHKQMAADSPDAAARYEMTEILCGHLDRVTVTDIEIRRSGPSYTIDTVQELKKCHPDADFYLLMGTDMLYSLEEWREAEKLCKLVTPVVFARGGEDDKKLKQHILHLNQLFSVEVLPIDHPVFSVSSSEVREMLCKREGRAFLPDALYAHIIKRSYYNAQPAIDWLWEQVIKIVPQKRIAHIKGTEEEAMKLAKHWGADVIDAQVAAILHDITKYTSKSEHLSIATEYAMMKGNSDTLISDLQNESEKLLHARTGAMLAKMKFGVSEAIYGAIFYHTTARAEMTLLEKIIYLADYIEPKRDFPEVEKLRELAYSDLDAALLLGLTLGQAELQERGIIPHSDSIEAMRYLQK